MNEKQIHRPTSENLVPIRLDIEIDGHRYKDAFTWNPSGIIIIIISLGTILIYLFNFNHYVTEKTLIHYCRS